MMDVIAMVNDMNLGPYESNSEKQNRVEAEDRVSAENAAIEVQERMRKIDLEVDDGWVYMHGQRVPKGVQDSERNVANAKLRNESLMYASGQFDEIVGSGLYKSMTSPQYQVEYVLGLLNKNPVFFGSQIAACQDILKSYKK